MRHEPVTTTNSLLPFLPPFFFFFSFDDSGTGSTGSWLWSNPAGTWDLHTSMFTPRITSRDTSGDRSIVFRRRAKLITPGYLGKYDVMVLCRKRIIRPLLFCISFFFPSPSPPPLLFNARNQTVSLRDWIWKCFEEEKNLTFARLSDTSCGRVAIDDDKSSPRIFERWFSSYRWNF